jgi:hypothetical protein
MSRIARRNIVPVSQITPLTYRDGVTYIQMLTELSEYVKSILHPSLQRTVDELVSDVEAQMDQHHDQYVDGVQEFQRIHDAFMSDVNASLIALNDGAASDLVHDETSLLGKTLRSVFTDRASFNDLSDTMEFRHSQHVDETRIQLDSINENIVNAVDGVNHEIRLRSVTPQDYGAVGDGVTDDTEALHQFFDALGNDDNISHGFIPDGVYWYTQEINLTGHTSSFSVTGASKHGTVLLFRGTGTPFMGQDVHDCDFRNFTIDAGRAQTGNITHGISFRRPNRLVIDNVHIQNYGNSSMLLFNENVDGNEHGNITINNTSADGGGVANNGLNIVNLSNVIGVNNTAYNGGTASHNSPSYGIQLKNQCINVHLMNSVAQGWKGGIVYGSDSGQGAQQCSLSGTSIDCNEGVVFGAVQNNQVEARIVNPKTRAINFGKNAEKNHVKATLVNVNTTNVPIRHGFHNNTVLIEGMSNVTNRRIVELTPSCSYNKNYILSTENIYANPSEMVVDNSNRTTNQTLNLGQIADLVATNTAMERVLRFDMEGRNSFISISSGGSWNFRADGDDIFTANMMSLSPGHDNRLSLGRASRRWTQIYAANGAISTSDAREKTNIHAITDSVLDAWSDVRFVAYQWKESVEDKGSNARTHFGVIAQHIKDVFSRHGLDAFDYGVLCEDVFTEDHVTKTRLGVRYDQAMILESALTRRTLQQLHEHHDMA